MTHPDRTAIHRMRQLFITWFPTLVRLFEHLADSADPDVLTLLINETLYEHWLCDRSSISPAVANEWVLRGAVRQARSFSRQHAGRCGCCPLSPLSFDERTVIYLAYTGYTRVQVANIVEIPCEDVDVLMRQGRERLRRFQGERTPQAPAIEPVPG
jgi:hypothetical protein